MNRINPSGTIHQRRPVQRLAGWAGVVIALLILHVVLLLPNRTEWLATTAFLRIPIELPLILLLLYVAPPGWRSVLRNILGAALAILLFLKLADMLAFAALARPFNPVLDLHLAVSGWTLLHGSLGTGRTALVLLAVLIVYSAGVLAIVLALRALARALPAPALRGRRAAAAGLALLGIAAILVFAASRTQTFNAQASGLVHGHLRTATASVSDRLAFQRVAGGDRFASVPDDRIMAGLAGKDVLLIFVESYGRSALEDPRYAPTVLPALDAFAETLAGTGYQARSGWVTAPVVGGQSWLAHASLLSGLWIDNQRRYDSLVMSRRETLVHAFGRAGWRTLAVMPAITLAWPEGEYFGYDAVYAAADLGYRGAPFNWVTMPDQYTLSALQRLELDHTDRPRVMAEIALISSHAPWTPIPPVIDWELVGDGSVFTPYALSGDPPSVVWRDPDRVRDQYLKSIDYALRNLASYLDIHGREDLVLIVLGDHQPAPLITGGGVTGESASFDVPMHILAADEAVIEALAGWGWTPGMRPATALPPWRMDAFRDRFLDAFTPPPAPEVAGTGGPQGGAVN